jgi:hypothetical protein
MIQAAQSTASKLLVAQRFQDKQEIRRTLGQTPHQVGIPRLAKRHIDAQIVPLFDQLLLEIATNAVEHLKLEAIVANLLLTRELLDPIDDRVVVRGKAGIVAVAEQPPCQRDIVFIDI